MATAPVRTTPNSLVPSQHVAEIGCTSVKLSMIRRSPLMISSCMKLSMALVKGVRDPAALVQELDEDDIQTRESSCGDDAFGDLKNRFSRFKRQIYLANREQYSCLAEAQSPKFMVIACADSRVCPSTILGFQPGEAFTVRNVANIVPPFQHGPSETSAALEFAVNSLEVGNILVVGHSRCGGIRALMSTQEEKDDSPLISSEADQGFIGKWVSVAKSARQSTKAAAGDQCFDRQCEHCEKESVNWSLKNLLSYPWVKERVLGGKLAIHGGYYDFVNCSFEKWTLALLEEKDGAFKCELKDQAVWS
ncbi:beta carbonic anhydrase 5, chloroplastic-like isoform X2 [Wolffia australiana]